MSKRWRVAAADARRVRACSTSRAAGRFTWRRLAQLLVERCTGPVDPVDLVPTVAGGDSRQDSRGIGDRAGKITGREDAQKNEGPGYPPETLSRWTPAVSTRCSELASRASLSSPRSETDGRQVAASPRAVRTLPSPVRDLPLLLSRTDLLRG